MPLFPLHKAKSRNVIACAEAATENSAVISASAIASSDARSARMQASSSEMSNFGLGEVIVSGRQFMFSIFHCLPMGTVVKLSVI